MLYWFFVKVLGPIARHRLGPTASGLNNVPRTGGAIIAANHLAVIDDALIPITCPRMVHFMGKAEYFEGKGLKGKFKKWWFTSVGVFPVDRSGGYKGHTGVARLALETGCPIVPTAIIGSRELQKPGTVIPAKGKTQVIYGKPIEVEKKTADEITHDDLRSLTDRISAEIQKMSGQEYVNEYAQKVKEELKAQKAAEEEASAE